MTKAKRKIARKKSNIFFNIFIGEYVQMMGEFSYQSIDGSIANMEGYLLDMDDDLLFLGATAEEISYTVRRDRIFSVHIAKPKTMYDRLLESFDAPPENAN